MTLSQLFAFAILMIIASALLGMLAVYSVTLPIDEGQELGALATAGLLRGLS